MSLKHLEPEQWDAVDAGTPDQETREHLATCKECRAVVAKSRALLVGLRRTGHTREPRQPLTTDHPAAEDLAAYGDGVLFGADARSIEKHLEHCSDCRDDIIVMRDVAGAGDPDETVSPEARDRLLERLSRAGEPEQVTSLGEWHVKASRELGAVFSRMASEQAAAAAAVVMASLDSAKVRHEQLTDERSKLEHALDHAREEAEQAQMMMDRATARMRDLWLMVEEMTREHVARAEEVAAAQRKAAEVLALMRDRVGLLELTAADLLVRIQATDRARPDVLTVTVVTPNDQPVPGVALEVRSPDGEPTLQTTDEYGHASFSLQWGESRLRLRHHGVWELQLARQS